MINLVVFLKWVLKTRFVNWFCFPRAQSSCLVVIGSVFVTVSFFNTVLQKIILLLPAHTGHFSNLVHMLKINSVHFFHFTKLYKVDNLDFII